MNNPSPLFAVVDVETTGGKPSDAKITEIAIITSDGKKIISEYSVLINPERNIDWYVVKLTGITKEMVMHQPKFSDLAIEIKKHLDGKIFVAHNVDFDYNILKRQFFDIGQSFNYTKVCTVKSSRKAFHGLSSYSLGNLTQILDIPLANAHRAADDARATAEVLHKILEQQNIDFLFSEIRTQNHIVEIPSHWKINDGKELVADSGIIYFHNIENEIICIESTKNFQRKIFSIIEKAEKNEKTNRKLVEETHTITLDFIQDEFKAEIKAINDIQLLKPKYSKPFKTQSDLFSIYLKLDEKKMNYLFIEKTSKIESNICPLIHTASMKNGQKIKQKLYQSKDLMNLPVLKKQILTENSPLAEIQIKEYNQKLSSKLQKEYYCSIKNGYYVFNIFDGNQVESIKVIDHYIVAWGQGNIENNKIVNFHSEFDFDKNQKITRKFLNILPRVTCKIFVEDEPSVLS